MTPPPPTKLSQATKTFVNNSGLLIARHAHRARLGERRRARATFASRICLHFVVNDIGMAFFFALAAKEVTEATAPGGALHSPRRAAMPLAAAVGGMLGPALIFITLTIVLDRPNLERGWAVPTATDIAFSYLAARIIFGARHPAIPFLLLLAIADDAHRAADHRGVLSDRPACGRSISPCCSAPACCSPRGCGSGASPASGSTCWAGVLSWMVSTEVACTRRWRWCRSFPFLPHAARDPGLFVEAPHLHDTLNEFEHGSSGRWT